MGLRGGEIMKHSWKYGVTAVLGALSLVVSGALAQAAPSGPDPSEGPISGGTKVTMPVPTAPSGGSLTEVRSSVFHSLGLDTDGKAWGWGSGQQGQLGNGSDAHIYTPVEVKMPGAAPEAKVTRVLFGGSAGTGLKDNGDGESNAVVAVAGQAKGWCVGQCYWVFDRVHFGG